MSSTVQFRGCALSYDVRGEGPPIVLIQGVGTHGDGWLPQVDELASRFRCLWFDNRGMGLSQPAGAPVTIDQMAEDVLAVMGAENWDSAHIVGHSLGGLVAQYLALNHRQRVRSLALLCTFSRGADVGRPSPRLIWLGLRMLVGTRPMRRRAFLKLVTPPHSRSRAELNALAGQLAPFFGHDLAKQPPITNKQLAAMRAYDAMPRLHELAGMPTLVVSAEHDFIAPPRLGRALAAGIPGSRYVEVAGAAHTLPIQQAARTNTLLFEPLDRCLSVDGSPPPCENH